MNSLHDYIQNIKRLSKEPRKAAGWIGITAIIFLCLWLDNDLAGASAAVHIPLPGWFKPAAHLVLIGISTALFTRLLGGIGMYRDAISDLITGDSWIETRNDLPSVWQRVTKRILLPGIDETTPDHAQLLDSLNETISAVINDPQISTNYYIRNAHRTLKITWLDRLRQIVHVKDILSCNLIPIDENKPCNYKFSYHMSSDRSPEEYNFLFQELIIDGDKLDPSNHPSLRRGNRLEYSIPLDSASAHRLERTMTNSQCLETDPIYLVGAGRVVWGFHALIIADRDIKVQFEEVGIEGAFHPVSAVDPNVRAWHTDRVLLPEQGFFVVLSDGASRAVGSGIAPQAS